MVVPDAHGSRCGTNVNFATWHRERLFFVQTPYALRSHDVSSCRRQHYAYRTQTLRADRAGCSKRPSFSGLACWLLISSPIIPQFLLFPEHR